MSKWFISPWYLCPRLNLPSASLLINLLQKHKAREEGERMEVNEFRMWGLFGEVEGLEKEKKEGLV